MDIEEARKTINDTKLWPLIRNYLSRGGEMLDFQDPKNRLVLLDDGTREQMRLWLEALPKAEEWKKIVDGAKVRELKASYPGVYPEVIRYLPYFTRFDLNNVSDFEIVKQLLKLKFPEAYELCCL